MSKALPVVTIVACLAISLCGAAQTALADGPCLLSASGPGAYAVRYWPDRAVLTYNAAAPVQVGVHLPSAVKWARLDDGQLAAGKVKWDAKTGLATADLPAGDHTVHLAWAGTYQKPPQDVKIPVLLGGKRVGELPAQFTLERMQADATLTLPTGVVRAELQTVPGAQGQPSLSVGATTLDAWKAAGRDSLTSDKPIATAEATPLSIIWPSYNLSASPVKAVLLTSLQTALEPKRLEKMPAGGIVIEAENIASEGLGKVEVSDKHFQTSGGKSVFNNAGNGHFLEYKFTVPQAGKYDLYVRAATQEPFDLRSVMVDGKPAEGLGLIKFPGTGGWGYSAAEWAALQLTGLGKAPSLNLAAGEHVLRITGEGNSHLNLDYFALVAR